MKKKESFLSFSLPPNRDKRRNHDSPPAKRLVELITFSLPPNRDKRRNHDSPPAKRLVELITHKTTGHGV